MKKEKNIKPVMFKIKGIQLLSFNIELKKEFIDKEVSDKKKLFKTIFLIFSVQIIQF